MTPIPLTHITAQLRAAERTRDPRAWERLARWQHEILTRIAEDAHAFDPAKAREAVARQYNLEDSDAH